MNDLPTEELAKVFGLQLAQAHLVIRCVVRALVQQPDFNAIKFLKTLQKEESGMSEDANGAKDVIKQIISEVEGYT